MLAYKINIKCTSGKNKGRKWPFTLQNDTVVIGRLKGCHLVVDDGQVSQSHCLIQVQSNKLYIVDMGSSFGTFVNDKQIDNLHELKSGDKIRIGSTVLSLHIVSPSPVKEKRPPSEDTLVNEFLAPRNKISPTFQSNTSITNLDIVNIEETNVDIPTDLCSFCLQKTSQISTIGEYIPWKHCAPCASWAHFIKVDLAKHYQIVGHPQKVDAYGMLLLAVELSTEKKIYLYVYRAGYGLDQQPLANNVLAPTNFQSVDNYVYATIPYIPGEFLSITFFNELSSTHKMKFIIQMAEAFEFCYSQWGEHKNIALDSIYVKADGQPLIYGYGIIPSGVTICDLHFSFQAPQIILEQKSSSLKSDIWSFAAILLFLQTGRSPYKGNTYKEIQKEAQSFMVEPSPIWHPFFHKIFSGDGYENWVDVISALRVCILFIR